MIQFLVDKIHDARFMTMLLAAIAAGATAYTLILPLFAGEGLAKRMKAVAPAAIAASSMVMKRASWILSTRN